MIMIIKESHNDNVITYITGEKETLENILKDIKSYTGNICIEFVLFDGSLNHRSLRTDNGYIHVTLYTSIPDIYDKAELKEFDDVQSAIEYVYYNLL